MSNCPNCDKFIYSSSCACGWIKPKEQQKRTKQPFKQPATPKGMASTKVAKICFQLVHDRVDGKLTSFELAEKLYDLDKEYPGAGFDEMAEKILKGCKDRGEI